MMTQESAIATCEQAIAQKELEQYVVQQADKLAPDVGMWFSLSVAT